MASPGSSTRKIRISPHRLRRICRYVAENLSSHLSLKELAEVACLSPFHFARMFKETTGLPPHKYVMKARLSEARYLLASSALPARLVAAQVGLTPGELSKQFRREFGVTTRDYRLAVGPPRMARRQPAQAARSAS